MNAQSLLADKLFLANSFENISFWQSRIHRNRHHRRHYHSQHLKGKHHHENRQAIKITIVVKIQFHWHKNCIFYTSLHHLSTDCMNAHWHQVLNHQKFLLNHTKSILGWNKKHKFTAIVRIYKIRINLKKEKKTVYI